MERNNTVLWGLDVKDATKKSYIFGTMHARSIEAYTHLEFASQFLNSCNVYAGEIDLGYTHTVKNDFYLPNGITLQDLLGNIKYAKYSKIVKKAFDFNLDELKNFVPLVAQNIILENLITKSNAMPLDFKLFEIAKESGKRMMGIETSEEQNNILKNIPIDLQLKMFKDAFAMVNKVKRTLSKTINLYAKGDIQRLYIESKSGLGKLRKIMLYKRNEIMADRIIELIFKDSVFVAIGAAHLGGNRGVLKLLNERGINIFPIKNN